MAEDNESLELTALKPTISDASDWFHLFSKHGQLAVFISSLFEFKTTILSVTNIRILPKF